MSAQKIDINMIQTIDNLPQIMLIIAVAASQQWRRAELLESPIHTLGGKVESVDTPPQALVVVIGQWWNCKWPTLYMKSRRGQRWRNSSRPSTCWLGAFAAGTSRGAAKQVSTGLVLYTKRIGWCLYRLPLHYRESRHRRSSIRQSTRAAQRSGASANGV